LQQVLLQPADRRSQQDQHHQQADDSAQRFGFADVRDDDPHHGGLRDGHHGTQQ